MGKVLETVSELNKFLRTLLAAVLVGAVGYGGGWAYYNLHPAGKEQELLAVKNALTEAQAELAQKETLIQDLGRRVDQLDTSLRLLKVTHRLAEVRVVNQANDPQTGQLITEVQFQEIDDAGQPIDQPKRIPIEGDMIYLDYWIVKFEDRYVEQADVDRSTSICLFRRIFGEFQEPREGFVLDPAGTRPNAYGRAPLSEFEQQIWSDFWNIANDPQRAAELGIRAIHGEAVSARLRPNLRYLVQLRASGGLSINPLEEQTPLQ
ncbi:MAG: hypothetical protein KDA60_03635 [Planctomycetales bacterium]|nr:hypothetical protein [Planctomycetales bacterium]